jgi:putative Mg2+ transporter-C (MgtC) family protein
MDIAAWLETLGAQFWGRVLLATLCGGVIGLERQIRGKPVGLRTAILICVGTVLFVDIGIWVQEDTPGADPTRVLGQVITGVGFLGAGAVIRKDDATAGLTSAATVWLLAGIGAAIGSGFEAVAASLTALTIGVLAGLYYLERAVPALRRGVHADAEEPGTARPEPQPGTSTTLAPPPSVTTRTP